ncbi:MAG: hypothetical protein GTO18_06430 [Anaerolineales bacterium]|nr:hypothetical protein [Anaerolineales bacterium]
MKKKRDWKIDERWWFPLPVGNPLHVIFAKRWLIFLIIFISSGLIFAYLYDYPRHEYARKFKDFPDLREQYQAAREVAEDINPNARFSGLVAVGRYPVSEKRLKYKTRLSFCDPENDNWALHLTAENKFKLFGPDADITLMLETPDAYTSSSTRPCEERSIEQPILNAEEMIDLIRRNDDFKDFKGIELYPRILALLFDNDEGFIWRMTFYTTGGDYAMAFERNYTTGEIVKK